MKKEPQTDPSMQKLPAARNRITSRCPGTARLFRDPEKMRQLWTPWVEPWFPYGLDDPDLGLLEVTVEDAEYWHAPASRMQRLFGLASALSTGKTDALIDHGKVHRSQ
jgi:hypothetical protein